MNNVAEMEEHIALDRIPKEMDGTEDWEYKYPEPVPGENDKMKDTTTRDALLEARAALNREYEQATLDWLKEGPGEQGTSIKQRRNEIAAKLKDSYWKLDPYVRARSMYDRIGVLKAGGAIDFYPAKESAQTNGHVVPVTEASNDDDVD